MKRKKNTYIPARVQKVFSVLLEEDLLGNSIYRSFSIQIDGQESAGEYDYSTSSTFNDVWMD